MSEKLTPVEKRITLVRTWSKRMDALIIKRQDHKPPYSEAQFCRDHNLDYGFFNRIKNLRVIPTQNTVKTIEKALSKENA